MVLLLLQNIYGFPLENEEESYCFVCQIRVGYDIQETEGIKKLKTMIKIYDNLMEDIQKCIDFEPKIDHFGDRITKQLGNCMEKLDRRI